MPCSLSRWMRSRTIAVCETPRAAVGSSRMTSLASHITARATATACRCPPESDPTSCRIDFTVVTDMSASVLPAVFSMACSSRTPYRSTSRPRNMFCTMSRLSHSARSW